MRISHVAAMLLGLALAGCGTGVPDPTSGDPGPAAARIYHPVHVGYAEYLAENRREAPFPRLSDSAGYYLKNQTDKHRYIRRSSQFGRAAMEFGRLLEVTMDSDDIAAAFGRVERVNSPVSANGLVVTLALNDFRFNNFRAHVSLGVSVRKDGQDVLSRNYSAIGDRRTRKDIRRAGHLAMRDSMRASTKDAMDEILEELMADLALRLKN